MTFRDMAGSIRLIFMDAFAGSSRMESIKNFTRLSKRVMGGDVSS